MCVLGQTDEKLKCKIKETHKETKCVVYCGSFKLCVGMLGQTDENLKCKIKETHKGVCARAHT